MAKHTHDRNKKTEAFKQAPEQIWPSRLSSGCLDLPCLREVYVQKIDGKCYWGIKDRTGETDWQEIPSALLKALLSFEKVKPEKQENASN